MSFPLPIESLVSSAHIPTHIFTHTTALSLPFSFQPSNTFPPLSSRPNCALPYSIIPHHIILIQLAHFSSVQGQDLSHLTATQTLTFSLTFTPNSSPLLLLSFNPLFPASHLNPDENQALFPPPAVPPSLPLPIHKRAFRFTASAPQMLIPPTHHLFLGKVRLRYVRPNYVSRNTLVIRRS